MQETVPSVPGKIILRIIWVYKMYIIRQRISIFVSHCNSIGICIGGKENVIAHAYTHERAWSQWKYTLPFVKTIEIERVSF